MRNNEKKEEDIMGTSYLIQRKKERLHADSELSMMSPFLFQRLFPGPKGSTQKACFVSEGGLLDRAACE